MTDKRTIIFYDTAPAGRKQAIDAICAHLGLDPEARGSTVTALDFAARYAACALGYSDMLPLHLRVAVGAVGKEEE